MRWIAFAILLYVVTVLQTAGAPFIAVHGVQPNLLVIVGVHFALTARTADALLACWFVGLAADLTGLGYARHASVGVNALAMGLVGLIVVGARDLTFRDSVVTQLAFTFLAAFLQSAMSGLYSCYASQNNTAFADVLLFSLYGAIYTAAIAPYGHWVMRRFRNLLGLGVTSRVRVG
jgi:rod shape-determining protein MreD